MLRMVHHDIAPAAGACAVALALDLIARPQPRAFLAGLALGAGALVRPELLLGAVGAGYALGLTRLTPFALGAAIAVMPWFLRGLATGAPGFNLSSYLLIAYTRSHPGLSPLWDFAIPPSRFPAALVHALPELPAKWLHLAPRAIKHALMAPGPGLGLVSALGLAAAGKSPRTRRWAWAALGAALIPVVLVTTTESSERYVAVFLPLWAVGAVQAAAIAGGEQRRQLALAALLALLLPFSFAAFATEARQSAAVRAWLTVERAALASRAAPGLSSRLMFSDTPDFAAWTTGRPVIATTLDGYRTLPATGDTGSSLPPRGGADDEWFHADVRATPAPTPGGAAADLKGGSAAPAR
jgi:hypothetical protein